MKSNPPRRAPARVRLPLWAVILIGLGITILIVGSSVWLFKTVQGTVSSLEIINPEFTNTSNSSTSEQLPAPSSNVESVQPK
jgi:hypothetical protein